MDWFRSWHGAPTDPKWLAVARRADVVPGIVSAVAWALFDHASQAEPRGSVASFDAETYAAFSGFAEDDISAVIEALRAKGLIDPDGTLTAWAKRQPVREDNSTARVQKHRAQTAPAAPDSVTADVTQCNATERSVTHGNSTEKNRTEKNRTEQNRTEQRSTTAPASPDASSDDGDPEFKAVCEAYHRNVGMLSPMIAEKLRADMADFSAVWVVEAIEVAVRSEKRNLSYVEGILKRWQQGGKGPRAAERPENGINRGFSATTGSGAADEWTAAWDANNDRKIAALRARTAAVDVPEVR